MALDIESVYTAAWAERNFCAEQALLKRSYSAPAVGSADANSRPDCSSTGRAHASARCRDRGPLGRMIASRPSPAGQVRRHTSSEACASVSTRRACRAWIGPARREPRPRRRRRATDKPSAHRFSDKLRQDAKSHPVSDGACADARRSSARSGGSPSGARSRTRLRSRAPRANPRLALSRSFLDSGDISAHRSVEEHGPQIPAFRQRRAEV
jgi:hypothetical protein